MVEPSTEFTDEPKRRADDARVVYSVRELLDQIRLSQVDGFARLETNLANKADKTDVARLETRLDRHQDRIEDLEQAHHDNELVNTVNVTHSYKKWSLWKKVATGVSAFALVAATVLGPYVGVHLHF